MMIEVSNLRSNSEKQINLPMFRCLWQINPLSTGVLMKHTPKIFTLSVALMALSLTSCGSGIDNEEEALPWCKEDVCDEGGASLLKCDIDTGRTTLKLCPFGCSNGTCKVSPTAECFSNADCPATKPVCASGTCIANDTPVPPAPECNINSDCPAAKPVCSNGTCVENSAVADVACQGVTCAKGTCDRGVCVTDEMKAVKEGDPCDDNFADFCRGDSMVFCSMANKVVVESCAQNGGCGIVNEKLQGGELLLSWCNGPSDQCKTEGQKIPFCTSNADGKSFESSFVCAKNTEGKFTAKDQLLLGEYSPCATTCNVDNTACDNSTPAPECKTNNDCKDPTKPVCDNGKCIESSTVVGVACQGVTCAKGTCDRGVCVTDEMKSAKKGDPCDGKTFGEFCNGDSMVYCGVDNNGNTQVSIIDCSDDGGCSIIKENDNGQVVFSSWCNGPSDKCTKQEQIIPYCSVISGNKSISSAYLCMKNTEDKFTAVNALSFNIYKECDTTCNADNTACEGETPKPECTENKDCPAAKPVCENGKCVENTTVVDVACQGVTCAKGTCDRGVCVTDEMKAAKKGDPCDGKTFGDFCNGDSMVYCSTANKVVVTDCSNDGGCSIIKGSDGKYSSWCNGPSNQCKNDDQNIPYCGLNANGYLIESSYICIKNTEGKFTAQDQSLYQGGSTLCATKCNADNTACDNSSTDYNKPCDNSFEERCDGNVAVYCNNNKKITPLPCDSTESCYLSKADNNANCFDDSYIAEQSCTQLNHEKMVCDRDSYDHHALVTYKCGSLTKYDNTDTIQVYFFSEGFYCNNGTEYTSCNADNTACQ